MMEYHILIHQIVNNFLYTARNAFEKLWKNCILPMQRDQAQAQHCDS